MESARTVVKRRQRPRALAPFVGGVARVVGIAQNSRCQQHEELGAHGGVVVPAEERTRDGDIRQDRDSRSRDASVAENFLRDFVHIGVDDAEAYRPVRLRRDVHAVASRGRRQDGSSCGISTSPAFEPLHDDAFPTPRASALPRIEKTLAYFTGRCLLVGTQNWRAAKAQLPPLRSYAVSGFRGLTATTSSQRIDSVIAQVQRLSTRGRSSSSSVAYQFDRQTKFSACPSRRLTPAGGHA